MAEENKPGETAPPAVPTAAPAADIPVDKPTDTPADAAPSTAPPAVGASSPAVEKSAESEQASAPSPAPGGAEPSIGEVPEKSPEKSPEKLAPAPPSEVDLILAQEDPEFTKKLGELAALAEGSGAEVDKDIEKIVAREKAEPDLQGWKKIQYILLGRPKRRFKEFRNELKAKITKFKQTGFAQIKAGIIHGLPVAKAKLMDGLKRVAAGLKFVLALKRQTKLAILAAVILTVGSAVAFRIAFTKEFMPKFESVFLRSFADVADAKFTYNKDDAMEDFNNPLLHPEHVVLIERIVANLKPPADGSNPMALIDVYIEVGTQEAAIEIKDRESEVRDVVGRTLEQMPYDELVNANGKTRFKIVLRKNLNEFLTKGRTRRIYFKSIVLKP